MTVGRELTKQFEQIETVRAGNGSPSVARVAKGCGLAAADVQAFYDLFAGTERTVTVYGCACGVRVSADSSGTVLNVYRPSTLVSDLAGSLDAERVGR